MLFVAIMSKKKILLYLILISLFTLGLILSTSNQENIDVSERTKIALRNVGNELLLLNNDSTSLVLPVKEVERSIYITSFENQLTFEPSQLVILIKKSFQKTSLSKHYRVEVIKCSDNEVAYSYEIKNDDKKNIVPCKGRVLPKECYTIKVKFTNTYISLFSRKTFLIALLLLLCVFGLDYTFSKPKSLEKLTKKVENNIAIGIFQFYPTQNKLEKEATEISLSKKECELLLILVTNQNQIVTREELTKKVWEDNGVFVGRSLDTYISKLRKKLVDDNSIKITNIHGVGYKLEVS